MLINENIGMPACLQKQEGKWSRGPVGLGTNLSVSYSKGKCTEHACALTVLLLIYCTWPEVETMLREDATNRSLIVKGTARGEDCLHDEKHSLALCLLGAWIYSAREFPEPTLMSCGGESMSCLKKNNIQFALPLDFMSATRISMLILSLRQNNGNFISIVYFQSL